MDHSPHVNTRLLHCLSLLLLLLSGFAQASQAKPMVGGLSKETTECLRCHKDDNVNIYQQWGKSKHYGAGVGCFECHQAKKGEADAFEHEGFTIAIIVSPKDCGRCHAQEVDEFQNSHHSKAGRIIGSLDNFLAEVVEGDTGFKTEAFPNGVSSAVANGCWQCHGTEVKVNKGGKLDPATWPNSGIGRINPDGSEGSCAACHSRHEFSVAQARQPENCGKCHMGPDHPQIEIYNESKHGIAYAANKDAMNLKSSKWVVGEDYFAAPTCATCHMSATKTMPVTHNVGLRIKWNNRPPVSVLSHKSDEKWGLPSASITADQRKKNMEKVCSACHNDNFVDGFYIQYESMITMYNTKYAEPGKKLYDAATKVLKLLNGKEFAQFNEEIDFTWYEIWHHEGRRARHGASMMGPDYTHWHGTYEVAKHWYSKYIPELKEVIERGKATPSAKAAAEELEVLLVQVQASPGHQWSVGKEDEKVRKDREKRLEEFKKHYK